jgi:hypothetical protein
MVINLGVETEQDLQLIKDYTLLPILLNMFGPVRWASEVRRQFCVVITHRSVELGLDEKDTFSEISTSEVCVSEISPNEVCHS